MKNSRSKLTSDLDWFRIPVPPMLAEPLQSWLARLNDYPPFLNFDPEYAFIDANVLYVKTNQVAQLIQLINGTEANKLEVYRFRDALVREGESIRQKLNPSESETLRWRLGDLKSVKIGASYPYVSFQDRQTELKTQRKEKETRRARKAAKKLPNEPVGSDRTFTIKVSIAPSLVDHVNRWLERMSFNRRSQQFHFDPKTDGVVSGILFLRSSEIGTLLKFANPIEASPFQVHKLRLDLLTALETSIRRRKNPSVVRQLKSDLEDARNTKTGANHPWSPPSAPKRPKRLNPMLER